MNILDEIKNSINSVIAERSVSPLFGSLILSWITWNWKILYAIFGQGEYYDFEDRIEYIEIYQSDKLNLTAYPIISALLILAIYPLASISAYWLWLKFDILKKMIRNNAERNELLTLDESVKVRIEIQKSKDLINNLITEKDKEIENLKKERDTLIANNLKVTEKNTKNKIRENENTERKISLKEKINSNKKILEALNRIFDYHKNEIPYDIMKSNVNKDSLEYLKLNKIVSEGFGGEIAFNYLGEEMYKEYLSNLLD
ncbi:hypothetical protein LPTSP2_39590 [Leptospira ellinghausenii]|uniref:Uncharacterized protein n=1 Tax=Leptospira ellinghausenii TaxID=1917822 RepID=A0A2P2DJ46_9LEPT|nr:hypothetical protein [Leptospira ellinghausenii]GBF44655.1 hypothetical protein LPTSP2_39590 [Leptospira ellinghausenii]